MFPLMQGRCLHGQSAQHALGAADLSLGTLTLGESSASEVLAGKRSFTGKRLQVDIDFSSRH